MSQLTVSQILAPGGGPVRMDEPSVLYAPGHVIQVVWGISKEKYYYPVGDNNDSERGFFGGGSTNSNVILRPLDITITPHSVNSFIHVEFNVCYEAEHNMGFQILRNGGLIGIREGDVSVDGIDIGNWQIGAVSRYDANTDTTPSVVTFCVVDRPGTTEPVTYSVGVRRGSTSSHTLVLNGAYSNPYAGQDSYEAGVSVSIAQEIAY